MLLSYFGGWSLANPLLEVVSLFSILLGGEIRLRSLVEGGSFLPYFFRGVFLSDPFGRRCFPLSACWRRLTERSVSFLRHGHWRFGPSCVDPLWSPPKRVPCRSDCMKSHTSLRCCSCDRHLTYFEAPSHPHSYLFVLLERRSHWFPIG